MKNIKLRIYAVLVASVCLVLVCSTACGKQNAETSLTPAQMQTLVCDSQGYADDMTVLVYPSDDFCDYVKASLGVQAEELDDGAVVYAGGARGDEIVILRLKDGSTTDAMEEAMRGYIEKRIERFTGYVPEMVLMLREATVETRGNYIALLICPQPGIAKQAFTSAFNADMTSVPAMQETITEEPEPEGEGSDAGEDIPAGEEAPAIINDEYDHDVVLGAWKFGDTQNLSAKNQTVFDKASEVIGELISEDMSEYEKELAIHDWIVEWADYDEEAIDPAPDVILNPDNATPYGLFVNQRAICKGYTTTFQLFMDMLDIECITVNGVANADKDEHAWNMVRLDGEWYCVDVTWDDPISSGEVDDRYHHTYFNVTTQFLLDTTHRWDVDSTPEATVDKYRWHGAKN